MSHLLSFLSDLLEILAQDKTLESMTLLSGLHFSKKFNATKILYFQSPKTSSRFCNKIFDFLGEQAFNYTMCFLGYRTETVFPFVI